MSLSKPVSSEDAGAPTRRVGTVPNGQDVYDGNQRRSEPDTNDPVTWTTPFISELRQREAAPLLAQVEGAGAMSERDKLLARVKYDPESFIHHTIYQALGFFLSLHHK